MKKDISYRSVRLLFLTLLMMLCVNTINAVPAKPGQHRTLTLSDGTTVSASLVGDEHGHYWAGADGKAYQQISGSRFYQAVDKQQVMRVAQQRRTAMNQRRMARMRGRRNAGQPIGDIRGDKKGLVILVNFPAGESEDAVTMKEEHNQALFNDICNKENYSDGDFQGSVHDYFLKQSEGKFNLTFDVVGPVTMSQPMSYYGKNDRAGDDTNPRAMVVEAINLVDNQVDFGNYDWDDDGYVDQVYIIYAGKGEADGGAANTIWPHEWQLSSAVTLDGKKIFTYACGAELNGSGNICGIGTMCHEFSHCLGYPDFYDTNYQAPGMFNWDLMDNGSYNGNGYLPAGYTSYERWIAGWMTPTELEYTQQIDNLPALQNEAKAYIIYNKGNKNEYFLLENRQKVGWDANIPGEGLLIIHVDYNESKWNNNEVNNTPSHQRMTWVAADNEYQYTTYQGSKYYTEAGAANDPFPYGSNNAFNKNTKPAAKFYNKNSDGTDDMDSSVENITQNDNGTVSFLFRGLSNVKTPVFTPAAGRYAEAQTVTISCETEGADIYYTDNGSEPTTSSTKYTAPITVSETTTIKAVAALNGETSEVATAKYTISDTASDPNTTTFQRVSSTDDLESGLRYIIACGSKNRAAGVLTTTSSAAYLTPIEVAISDDVITITDDAADDVAVFVLEQETNGWSLRNEADDKYLYASDAKKLAYSTTATHSAPWTLSNGTDGVILTYNECGTMLFNSGSPRFTTYTSTPSASMIQANLYVEHKDNAYYKPADGKKGSELKTAMKGIIYNRTEKNYNDLWEAFKSTDVTSDGKIWDMYSNITSYTPVSSGSTYEKEGDCYNREHSFPQSWFGSTTPAYSDLHHIYPTDGFVNGKRDNYPFGETSGGKYKSANDFSKLGPCTYPGYTGIVFEPADEYKGDFARTYFYMVTCYEEQLPTWYTTYSDSQATLDGKTYPGLSQWQLKMLLKWAKDDPVSEKEIARNEAVYGIQKNRNPFIDYPGLQEYIWGFMTDATFSYDDYVEPVYPDEPDPVTGDNVYALVTDASTLAAGDKILIAYVKDNNAMALGTNQKTNNREAVAVTLNTDGTLTPSETTQVITLEKDGSNFLFNVGTGYLYASSNSANQLKTQTKASDDAKASISITNGEATILFQGTNTHNFLRYNPNNGTPLFACYLSTSTTGSLPQIYRKVTATEPETVEVAIGATGYATLYYGDKNLVVPEGVEAYVYHLEGNELKEQPVGDVINAGTAVVLKATETLPADGSVFEFEVTDTPVNQALQSDLYGYDEDTETSLDGNYLYYMLSLNAEDAPESIGFYYGADNGGAFTSLAHRAFLALPAEKANGVKALLLNGELIIDTTTGLSTLQSDASSITVFNLNGQRVNAPKRPGIYVIGGRKVIIK